MLTFIKPNCPERGSHVALCISVLVNSQNEYLFNGQYLITQYPMTVKVKGAALFYTGSATVEERINSTGTLGENLTLQVLVIAS
ncbi:hypothetical protein DPMN_017479 [Dreissena polymorpha]|uniref:ADAMTS/ADAMTS-like Spacer 1 domain-containing protein n=1 Tax=Dreissena polymorpha TaxID=45954 RepID=A0A9D4NBG4_DREPO|nr:hypothetical protein DPMN_017479 [Dreissena polymorpha]